MFGAVMLTYGMLVSFVLSGAERNRRLHRPNPRTLQAVGHVLTGFSAALALGLPVVAAYGAVPLG